MIHYLGEKYDEEGTLPEKTGGGPAAGDSTITGGEAEAGSGSGTASTPSPTLWQRYDGATNQPIGIPYPGPPGIVGQRYYD